MTDNQAVKLIIMFFHFIAMVGFSLIWLLPSSSMARNTTASRLIEQPRTLSGINNANSQPFVLPPIDSKVLGMAKPTSIIIRIKDVIFSGNTVFSATELHNLAEPFLDRDLDASALEELRYRISQHYLRLGYLNSGAVLPSQNLQNRILHIHIVEGRLSTLQVQGEGWLHPDYLRKRLTNNKPFNVKTLQQRYLQLLNDPLIEHLNGNLKPLPTLGESALELKVTRALPYQLALHLNNYNPPSIGAEQMQVEAWLRNLTRWGDKLDFRFDLSQGAANYSGGWAIPITSDDTLFDFHFETGRTSVIEEPLGQVDISSYVNNFTWSLSHPFYRDIDQSILLGVGFSSRNNQTQLMGRDFSFVEGLATGQSKTTALRFFQEYLGRFERHAVALRSSFSVGIDTFGATIQKSENTPDSQFFAWLGQLQYAYKLLDNGAQLRLHGNLQLSTEPLLPQERIAIGGVYSVRGYRENELVRDNGYSASIELAYPLLTPDDHLFGQLTLVPFMDFGSAWNVAEASETLHAIGGGLNWQLAKHLKADFYYAYALKAAPRKTSHDLQDAGIFFNLSLLAFE